MNTPGLARTRVRAKTSIEIMRERDELDGRLRDVGSALDVVEGEIAEALRHPEIAFTTLCRVAAMVRRARESATSAPSATFAVAREDSTPESGVRSRSA